MRYAELLGQSTAAYRAWESLVQRLYSDAAMNWRWPAGSLTPTECSGDYSLCREMEPKFGENLSRTR